jgi:regulatory protein|tara:strand:- start:368 stop:865 length:498 start_codon:yes stop_codon:yes gene_type:complete
VKKSVNELNSDLFDNEEDKFSDPIYARKKAMDFLALREYGQKELIIKLQSKGFSSDISTIIVEKLTDDGLQDDQRFAESYVRSRIAQGKGPIRIHYELEQKKMPSNIIQSVIENTNTDWIALAEEVKMRKFGEKAPENIKDKAKQTRFLYSRGFSNEHIRKVLKS